MCAPNSPVGQDSPSPLSAVTNALKAARPSSGGAALEKLGRLPDIVSAASVNCETQSTSPPTSTRLVLEDAKSRGLACELPDDGGRVAGLPAHQRKKPAADGPGHASFNAHRGFGHSLDQNDHDPLLRRS